MNSFADRLAAELVAHAGMRQEPPIDVQFLARNLGVVEIVEADIIEDGRLHADGTRHTIYVRRRNVTPQRRRFTIAHELGHLALGMYDGTGVARRYSSTDEERLCDQIAAAILIPAAWLRSHFAGRRHNLSTLRQLKDDAGTSLAAGLVRCREVLGWPESLLRWSHDGHRWRFRGGAGIPLAIHAHIQSAPTTSEALVRLGNRRSDQQATIPVAVRGREVDIRGQFSIGSRHAIGIVQFQGVQGGQP